MGYKESSEKLNRPEKYAVRSAAQYIKKVSGFVNHHWSYNGEHILDTIQLSERDHKKVHKFTQYDPVNKMYRTKIGGDLLDSRFKHITFINFIKSNYPESIGKLPVIEYVIQ